MAPGSRYWPAEATGAAAAGEFACSRIKAEWRLAVQVLWFGSAAQLKGEIVEAYTGPLLLKLVSWLLALLANLVLNR